MSIGDFKVNKLQILAILVLLTGLLVGIFLVQRPQIFKSKATFEVNSALSITGVVSCSRTTCETTPDTQSVTISVRDAQAFLQLRAGEPAVVEQPAEEAPAQISCPPDYDPYNDGYCWAGPVPWQPDDTCPEGYPEDLEDGCWARANPL